MKSGQALQFRFHEDLSLTHDFHTARNTHHHPRRFISFSPLSKWPQRLILRSRRAANTLPPAACLAAAASGDNTNEDLRNWTMKNRDEMASEMTALQIEKAQEMARHCQQSKFEECD